MIPSRQIGWDQKTNLYWQISKQLERIIGVASKIEIGSILNPFTSVIIDWLNLLTDSSNTEYDGITPSNSEIETYVDNINGEIV